VVSINAVLVDNFRPFLAALVFQASPCHSSAVFFRCIVFEFRTWTEPTAFRGSFYSCWGVSGVYWLHWPIPWINSHLSTSPDIHRYYYSKGTFHQRRSNLNQVQIWPWPRFSRNFCCTNAVQIKSRVKLGLTLNRRRGRIKLWSWVQLAYAVAHACDPCHLCPDWWQFGIKCICV